MENNFEVIENLQLLGNVIKSLFGNLPITMLYENEEIPIRTICVDKEFIVIRSTGRKDKDDRILTFTNSGSLYHFYFHYSNKSTEDLEYLEPKKLIIFKKATRQIERTILDTPKKKSYVGNFILEREIWERLSENLLWQKVLKETLQSLKAKFDYVNFIQYNDSELRFKVILHTGKPIFFPRREWVPMNNSFSDIKGLRQILPNEKWNDLKGPEITIPLYLRSKKLLGVLVVKNQKDLELGDYTLTNMLFSLLQRELNQNKKIYLSTEKFPILDISMGGVGFLITDPKLFSYFQVGEELMLEIFLGEISWNFSTIVRNTNLLEKDKLRVGVQFQNLTQEESLFLESFYSKS